MCIVFFEALDTEYSIFYDAKVFNRTLEECNDNYNNIRSDGDED